MEEIKVFNTDEPDDIVLEDVPKSSLINIQFINMLGYCEPIFASNPHTSKNNQGVVIQSSRNFIGNDKSMKQYRIAPSEKVSVIGIIPRYKQRMPKNDLYTNVRDLSTHEEQLEVGELPDYVNYMQNMHQYISDKAGDYDKVIDEINYIRNWYSRNLSVYKQEIKVNDFIEAVNPVKQPKSLAKVSFVPIYDVSTSALAGLLNEYIDYQLGNRRAFDEATKRFITLQQIRETLIEEQKILVDVAHRERASEELYKKPYKELTAKERNHIETYKTKKELDNPRDVAIVEKIISLMDVQGARTFRARVCEHYKIMIDVIAKGKDYATAIHLVVQKMATANESHNYYCKNCGKLLLVDDSDNTLSFRQQGIISTEDNPLVNAIMSEATQILRYVAFKHPQNQKSLLTNITNLVVPKIEAIQVELQKSKTKSIDDIRLITLIYIDIYVFALMANMMIHNTNVMFNVATKTGGKANMLNQQDAAKILSTAYTMVIDSNKGRFTKITEFATENIKPILLDAFRWVQTAKFETSTDDDEYTGNITNNSIYNAIYQMSNKKFDDYLGVIGDDNPFRKLESDHPFDYVLKNLKGDEYNVVAFRNFLEYVETGVYREFASPLSTKLKTFYDLSEKVNNDKTMEIKKIYNSLGPFRYLHNPSKVHKFENVDLSDIYCVDGRKHKFALGVCLLCGVKQGSSSTQMNNKIKDNLSKKRFFKFFEYRCPISSSHEYNKKSDIDVVPCKKCGKIPGAMDDTYYKKYGSKLARVVAINKIPYTPINETYKTPIATKWMASTTKIIQLANQSQINYNVWINLGLSEGYLFEQIKNGKINPSKLVDEKISRGRVTKLKNYINYIRVQYNLVKNNANAFYLPIGLKQLVEEHGVPDLKKNMPNLFADYDANISYYELHDNPENVCNFILNAIANALIQMRTLSVKKTTSKLFEYLCENLVKFETQTSVVQAKKIIVAEINIDEVETTNVADILDLDEEHVDPFSFDDIDIETTNMGLEDEEYMD